MRIFLAIIMLAFTFGAQAQDSTKVNQRKKPIERIKVWKDGKVYDADDIEIVCAFNDMETSATFYYKLEDSTGAIVSDGNVVITGDDYKKLSTLANWNDRAAIMVMRKLNVADREKRALTQAARQATTATTPKQ
jgi:outer membrane lipoprotein-sorting protein